MHWIGLYKFNSTEKEKKKFLTPTIIIIGNLMLLTSARFQLSRKEKYAFLCMYEY